MEYEKVVYEAWQELLDWCSATPERQERRLNPENEEEIQCFLYYGIVRRLGDARFVKPKPVAGKAEKHRWSEGKLLTGDTHFPDFIIGENKEVVIEIKFARLEKPGRILQGCRDDIGKMLKHYSNSKRIFIVFDMAKEMIFLSERQLDELKAIDQKCVILRYPEPLHPPKPAERAIDTLREKGRDLHKLGKENAKKAMFPKK